MLLEITLYLVSYFMVCQTRCIIQFWTGAFFFSLLSLLYDFNHNFFSLSVWVSGERSHHFIITGNTMGIMLLLTCYRQHAVN